MTLSPEQYILASAFGGALVAGLIAIITLIANGRREHTRWRLDLMFKSYNEYVLNEYERQMRVRLGLEAFPYKSDDSSLHGQHIAATMLINTQALREAISEWETALSACSKFAARQLQVWNKALVSNPNFRPAKDCPELLEFKELVLDASWAYASVVAAMRVELRLETTKQKFMRRLGTTLSFLGLPKTKRPRPA